MKNTTRSWVWEFSLVAVLIGIGVGLRMACIPWPNLSPVAGIALMGGVMLRHRLAALLIPLGIMLISDQYITNYELPVMLSVYGCLMLPALLGHACQRWLRVGKQGHVGRSLALGAGGGFAAGGLFFLVTNAAYWACFELGHKSLLACYVDGLPFFKYTLAGDLAFSLAGMTVFSLISTVVLPVQGVELESSRT